MKKQKVLRKFPHQFFYFIGLKIRKVLLKLSEKFVPAPVAVYEKAQGLWISRAIVTACELNLADLLASGPKDIHSLSAESKTDPDFLYRLMRALAGEGIFRELPGKVFMNTPLSGSLKEGENSLKYLILQQFGHNSVKLLLPLTEVIQTGENHARKIFGKNVFEYLENNPEKNDIYNKGMDNSSGMMAMALLSSYSFKGIQTMVDIGGGHGLLLAHILEKYPKMSGILFDQPHVVENAFQPDAGSPVSRRYRVAPGNFFEDIPTGADAYFMKNVLHAFHEDECIVLLRKIYAVMPATGRLILLETVISPDNKPALGKLLDFLMMTGTDGGRERTREEFTDLLSRSGFTRIKFHRTLAPFFVIEAIKK